MSHPPSYFVRAILGLPIDPAITLPASGDDWPCYAVNMPDGPEVKPNLVCVYDDEGLKQGKLARTLQVIERHAVQIMVRSTVYPVGYTKVRQIVGILDQVKRSGFDVAGEAYEIPAIRRNGIFPLGQDPTKTQRRYLFALNVDFILVEHGLVDNLDSSFPVFLEPVDETWFTA